jgi:hypothetical protein
LNLESANKYNFNNTSLKSPFGGPIAQAVANGAGCLVYGTRGYMKGRYAQGNEKSFASPSALHPYPCAEDALGRYVWIAFYPQMQLQEVESKDQYSLRSGKRIELHLRRTSKQILNTHGWVSFFYYDRLLLIKTLNNNNYGKG